MATTVPPSEAAREAIGRQVIKPLTDKVIFLHRVSGTITEAPSQEEKLS